mmetsp:Transcript_15608/g.29814  ORF Transcript_15608/g.29814 Transcript_15608/m.29814 type:complete len:106 (+) Transcript_15608:1302-1619(+)
MIGSYRLEHGGKEIKKGAFTRFVHRALAGHLPVYTEDVRYLAIHICVPVTQDGRELNAIRTLTSAKCSAPVSTEIVQTRMDHTCAAAMMGGLDATVIKMPTSARC